jgi:hypothetical protein
MDNYMDRLFCKNALSLLLVLTLLFVVALGCSFDLGKKLNTSTETSASPTLSPKKGSEETEAKKPITQADASKKEVPSDDEAQEMVKTTLLDFNKGIQKEDFTDFYDTISRTWKKEITPQKFNEAFAEFIEKKIDLSDISSEEADFSPSPSVAKEQGFDMLTLAGEYETSPTKTKFELKYIPQGKDWKLSRIRVILGP